MAWRRWGAAGWAKKGMFWHLDAFANQGRAVMPHFGVVRGPQVHAVDRSAFNLI